MFFFWEDENSIYFLFSCYLMFFKFVPTYIITCKIKQSSAQRAKLKIEEEKKTRPPRHPIVDSIIILG